MHEAKIALAQKRYAGFRIRVYVRLVIEGIVCAHQIACLNGKRFRARAKHYVLATGGIENARLLLNSIRVQKFGLGNAFDQLGRYFMDHPYVIGAATIVGNAASPELRFYDKRVVRGRIVEGFFCATDEVRRRERLPPFAINLWALDSVGDDYPDQIVPPQALRNPPSDSLSNQITYYLTRSVILLESPAQWLYKKMWRQQPGRLTTFYTRGPDPDPQSRVTLINSVDALGMRKVQLDWRLPENFELQMQRAHELLAQDLGRTGQGRLRIESTATEHDPMKSLGNAHHHMGTTRMHNDARRGVVDANCRVHGIGNLFIGGGSVFPTYACDGPTMTIVALALRMSNHLKSALSS